MAGALNPATYWENPAAFANNFSQCFNFTAQGLAVARDVRAASIILRLFVYAYSCKPAHLHAHAHPDLRVFRWRDAGPCHPRGVCTHYLCLGHLSDADGPGLLLRRLGVWGRRVVLCEYAGDVGAMVC